MVYLRFSLLSLTAVFAIALSFDPAWAGSGVLAKEQIPKRGLQHTFESMELMTEAALAALAAEDMDRLRELAVTRQEFHQVVWPQLDAARPERRLPWDFVWTQHEMRHERGLKRAMALLGSQQVGLEHIEITSGVRDFGTYRIHSKSEIEITDADGAQRTLRLFASVIEVDGQYKIYSFITD